MTMTLIETKTLGAAAASIEFTSIPQTFTDLVLVSSARNDSATLTSVGLEMRFNGATANRSNRGLGGQGSTTFSFTSTVQLAGIYANLPSTSNTFGNSVCYIPNYSGATPKSSSVDCVNENNATEATQIVLAQLWNDTAAITSIFIQGEVGGNLVAGSTFSLFGLTKCSDGIVTNS